MNNYSRFFVIFNNKKFIKNAIFFILNEYRRLFNIIRNQKPFRIIDILYLSDVPGETKFSIQVVNKNCVLSLTTGEIFNKNFNLEQFDKFHANMIRYAAQGKLREFLQVSNEIKYKIVSKSFDKTFKKYFFTIEDSHRNLFKRTSDQLSSDKSLLQNMHTEDIYDVAYTHGVNSIIKEQNFFRNKKNVL